MTGPNNNASANSTSNILSLPFRKGAQLSLTTVIRQYISTKYDQHPDMFRQDLEVIDALRRDAVNVREAHPSGIKKLQAYAGQLAWIGGKFPLDVGEPGVVFKGEELTPELGRLALNLHGIPRWGITRSVRWCGTTSSTNL